jgi:serine/threonine-protein kinase
MGAVYLGKDAHTGRRVAIKTFCLRSRYAPEDFAEVKDCFFREVHTARRLSHPSIATIYDAGEEHDVCYVAMEFLGGGSLERYTKPTQLLLPEKAVSIIARAADALGYAHRQGVVHGNVKPSNLMYEPQSDTLKVTDFGMARVLRRATPSGTALGTPAYRSPEQLAGGRIDARADLFSLAVVLYQLLSGHLPFEAESVPQLMFRIANEPPAPLAAEAAAGLVQFLDRALAKDAAERFQTGEHFGGALRAALAAATVGHARAWT